MTQAATRAAIVAACRAMTRLGINQGMSGNISVRHAGAMLITPTATPYDLMTPEDIATMPLHPEAQHPTPQKTPLPRLREREGPAAKRWEGEGLATGEKPKPAAAETTPGDLTWTGPKRPSSEWRFHRDILATRPEIGAIVHAHPVHCTALAIARRGIPPCHYMVATFGGEDVRCAGYATFGTQALSTLVLEALQDRTACLMANHGMIACGRDLDQAMWRATELEALARQYLASLAAGGPVLLTQQEIADAVQQFANYRP